MWMMKWFTVNGREWFFHVSSVVWWSDLLWMVGNGFSTCHMMCWIQCTASSSTPTTTTTAFRSTQHHQSTLITSCTSSSSANSSLWYICLPATPVVVVVVVAINILHSVVGFISNFAYDYERVLRPFWVSYIVIKVRTIVTIGLSLRPIVALSDDYRSR